MKYKNKVFNTLKKFILDILNNHKYIIYMFLSFAILDLATRLSTLSIGFFGIFRFVPNFFTLLWVGLILGICCNLKSKWAKVVYNLLICLAIVFFLTNMVYYNYFKTFFDFSLLKYASEGSDYFLDAIKSTPVWVYIIVIITIGFIITANKEMNKLSKTSIKNIMFIIIIFIGLYILVPFSLGGSTNNWDAWRNPRNVYNSFNDNNRSMQVAGFYEYMVRGFYVTYFRHESVISEDDMALLAEKFQKRTADYKTDLTGIFKDKNVLFIQLESIDDFLVTSDIMPTLYSLRNKAYNFNNHYSFVSGGGSTFNSEFMINTGYTNPISYNQGPYTFSKNDYTYSLPNLFKNQGYTVNAFHMNSSAYYSRSVNYDSWGFDEYYSLKDMDNGTYYKDKSYFLDTELILNPNFNELIFPIDKKFVSYIITYSAHMPYQVNKGVCNLLVDDHSLELTELECLKIQAKETDDMLKLVLDNLEEKGLIDNTIIVTFADHYLYTLNDKTILDGYKNTSNNLINKTPFMIWGNNLSRKDISKVTSQLNILPTIANMFGLDYHDNYYLGEDALNDNYSGLVFFNDYSWYDGNVYVENGEVTNGRSISEEELERKNNLSNKLIRINDTLLKTNYFKILK